MAGKVFCEATKLYNILNQYTFLPRLAESNYLCLIDARAAESYNFSHIITARNAKWDSDGKFIIPLDVEVESMRCIIVYDSSTHSLSDSGPAIDCADSIEKSSQFPVQILSGGYEKFSALYPFLRTPKILYNIRELESLNPYPVEILPGKLYMGDYRQATNLQILKDLKLNALVNVSDECIMIVGVLNISGSHLNNSSSVLIFSTLGVSRCCAVTMAYLMYHLKYTLKEAWNHIQQCKANMKPNRGFVQQLSDWELQTLGKRVTDISEPNY
uniref:Tyrosine-protein phosphatase domain-containing protein n=1 Tax=Sinocyclocheilus grahami TaxID=75366 RepID=A0A672P9Z8_SINGR